MTQTKLVINYQEFDSPAEMSPEDQELIAAAHEARKGSYSPYSNFQVGAALRLDNGLIVKGANQENAAYPSGLCAEPGGISGVFLVCALDNEAVIQPQGSSDLEI